MSLLRFLRPRLVLVEGLHAPFALAGGRTPVRVVAEGSGVLLVDGRQWRFAGGLDQIVLVEAAARVVFRVRGWLGGDVRDLALVLCPGPTPPLARLRLPPPPAPRIPSPRVRITSPRVRAAFRAALFGKEPR